MSSIPKPPEGHFNVLYFASARSYTGRDFDVLPAPLLLGKLFETLEGRYGGIRPKVLDSCLVTVNLDYVDVPSDSSSGDSGSALVVQAGDEVAIIPPVSSG